MNQLPNFLGYRIAVRSLLRACQWAPGFDDVIPEIDQQQIIDGLFLKTISRPQLHQSDINHGLMQSTGKPCMPLETVHFLKNRERPFCFARYRGPLP